MQPAAIIVGVAIAAAGWVANGILARRAVRRQTRVEYLLSAYRRLEAASNRELGPAHEKAIESAVSDIQLLGTKHQVELADAFAKEFAADRSANAEPLLEDLRRTLRKELLLQGLVPRRTWLRITRVGDWGETGALVRARILPATSDQPVDGVLLPEELETLVSAAPSEAVFTAFDQVEKQLRVLLGQSGDSGEVVIAKLAQRAADRQLITPSTAEAFDGLRIMRNLAETGQKEVKEAEARDFAGLAEAVLYAVKRDSRS